MKGITSCLWFDGRAEEAARFHTSIFPRSRIRNVVHYGGAGPGPRGSVMLVIFELDGRTFMGLNGGPQFAFSPAVSFIVNCDTQQEIDELWEKLSDGGKPDPCGWLTDRYGLSWQIVPAVMGDLVRDDDPVRADRVMKAVLEMRKLEIADLERAYAGDG